MKSGNTTISAYSYDGLGHRITETPDANVETGPATDLYYSSQWQVVQENQDGDGLTVQTRYVWSPVYVNAMVLRDYKFSAGNFTLNDRTYALQDANYDTTALVDYQDYIDGDANNDGVVDIQDLTVVANHWQETVTGGAADGDFNNDGVVNILDLTIVANNWQAMGTPGWKVVQRMSYDAYGKQTVYNKFWVAADDFLDWNYGFQGGREDKSTGDINFDERDYDPRTYTWNTKDPLGFVNGPDTSQFVTDNPIRFVDPAGTEVFIISRELNMPFSIIRSVAAAAAFAATFPIGGGGGIPGAAYADRVANYYGENTWHCWIAVTDKCNVKKDAKGNVSGFTVAPNDSWDFQTDRVHHPAKDLDVTLNPVFPSSIYSRYKITQMTTDNKFDAAVKAAAGALTPAPHPYRQGGALRYNCCDWVADVMAKAGLGWSNPNPKPFGPIEPPLWVPNNAIGKALDELPSPL